MLSKLQLKNFKAFESVSVDFRAITLFLGPNNSGKSSIIAAPRLLAQTVDSLDSRIPLLLNGTMGDFGTYKDIVYGNHGNRHLGIDLKILAPRKSYGLDGMDLNELYLSLGFRYRAIRREVILKSVEIGYDSTALLSTAYSQDSERQLVQRIGKKPVPSPNKSSLARALRMQNFVPTISPVGLVRRYNDGALDELLTDKFEDDSRSASRIARSIYAFLQRIEYVSAMRLPPARTHLLTGEKRERIGSAGENTANIMVIDAARGGSRSKRLAKDVSGWLNQAGIASDIETVPLSDRHYEIRVQHPVTREYQNIADVGYSLSQILPVLVGGYNLSEDSTYIVEEPEIHLHPRAQAELGDFFLSLYRRGVQSVVETHSEHLTLRLQQYVASGAIPPEDIRFYYVYAKGHKKKIVPLDLDTQGRFVNEWPEGFFPELLEEAKKLSKIRFQQQFAQA